MTGSDAGRPLRILFTCDQLAAVGGIERFAIDMATSLHERGHIVHLVYRVGGDYAADWQRICQSASQVPTLSLSRSRSRDGAISLGRSAGLVRRGLDVVYVHNPWEAVYGRLVATPARAGLVCHLHLPAKPVGKVRSFGLRGVGRFIAVSGYVARQWSAVTGARETIIHNGVDGTRWRPLTSDDRSALRHKWGIPDGAPLVVYAGRLEPRKGPDLLIKAVRRDGYGLESTRLMVIGSAAVRSPFETPLEQIAGSSPVYFVPRQKDLRLFFAMADLVVLPSTQPEALPLVCLEAMACGVPAIAAEVGGVAEMYTGSLARLLTVPGSEEHLAAKIGEHAGWRTREPDLGPRCRKHVLTMFRWTDTVEAVEGELRSAAKTCASRALRAASKAGVEGAAGTMTLSEAAEELRTVARSA